MEGATVAANFFKYLFLGVLYLFILGLFWGLWRQTRELAGGTGRRQRKGRQRVGGGLGTPIVVIESGTLRGRRFAIERELTIGRSPDNAIVLPDRFVSSRHATVRRQGNEAWLVDEGSTNGTFLNGFRVTAASALRPGDTFVIGETTFCLAQD